MSDDQLEDDRAPEGVEAPFATYAALGAASRERADIFLAEQTRLARKQSLLADMQIEDMRRENKVRHWSLRVRHVSDVLKLSLELAAALLVAAILIFVGRGIWTAANDKGLVIEALHVPDDLAAKGLTGEVVATQIQDRLAWMQAHTDTIRAASTYSNNWANDIKVQIPDTGISIGEFYRYLANWLGHQTHITGEMWRTATGVSLSIRSGGDAASTFSAPEEELSKLVVKASEQIYWNTQAYRYAVFLGGQGRYAEALAAIRELAVNGPMDDRPWAYSRWGLILVSQGDAYGDLEKQRIAARLGPNLPHVWENFSAGEAAVGHDEIMLGYLRHAQSLLKEADRSESLSHNAVRVDYLADDAMIADELGDYMAAVSAERQIGELPSYSFSTAGAPIMIAADLALAHDVTGEVRAARTKNDDEARGLALFGSGSYIADLPSLPGYERAVAMGDWRGARDDLDRLLRAPSTNLRALRQPLAVTVLPRLAYANARIGDFAHARELIDKTPRDCYVCARMRGNIYALQRNWREADRWFASAVNQAPSLPLAYFDWGTALLARGDPAGAIDKFEIAHRKGPHFADALEMWGEALVAENRSDLALSKFAEANNYAPRWGRLHLKWGEALLWSGDREGAKNQFATAAALYLAPSDRAAIAKLNLQE